MSQVKFGTLETSIGECEITVEYWSPAPDDGFHENFFTVMFRIGEVVGWYPIGKNYLISGINRLLAIHEAQNTETVFLERPNPYRDRYIRFDPRPKAPRQRFLCVQDGNAQLIPGEGGQLCFNTEPDGQFRWVSKEVMEAVDITAIHELARNILDFIIAQTENTNHD